MITYEKKISLTFLMLLTGIIHNSFGSQKSPLMNQEYLETYALCLKFEKGLDNLPFFKKIFPLKSDSLIAGIKVIMKDKQILFNCSLEELQEIKAKLTLALAELELLEKKDSMYRKWTKLVLKLFIINFASRYVSNNNTIFSTPLRLLNIYYSVGLSITTFNILNDLIEKIF